MADGEMVCKFCNLRQRDAAFAMVMPGSFEDNMRILGLSSLKCLDMEDCCYDLGCKFAKGNINPFDASHM